jgi:hypothetical protein
MSAWNWIMQEFSQAPVRTGFILLGGLFVLRVGLVILRTGWRELTQPCRCKASAAAERSGESSGAGPAV